MTCTLFVVRSLTYSQPVVDLRALSNRNFALGCFLSFVAGIGIFTTIYLTPLFLGYVRGFSAWQTGTAIFSTGAASLIGTPIYILLARKIDLRWLLMGGLTSFALAMWSYSFITHDWGSDQLLLPQILRGLPQVFAVAPVVNLGLGSLPPDRLKFASGLFNMMRNLGGAVGIAVSAAVVNDQTNSHFVRIASHLTPANGAMERLLHGMVGRYGALPGSARDGQQAALQQLWHLRATTFAVDASEASAVAELFDEGDKRLGEPDLVIYNASARAHGPIANLDPAAVQKAIAITAFGGFLVTQQAAKRMVPRGRGAILLTGATASVKGFALSSAFAMGKFALCGLAQSAARELGSKGIHVAHLVIDGGVRSARHSDPTDKPDSTLDPDAIAQTYIDVLRQHRSAWSLEVEVRPWVEDF